MSETTSSRALPDRMKSSTAEPAWRESVHQSRRTRSRPFVSRVVTSSPPFSSTISAAYFFFLSSSIDFITPSMSISMQR